MRNYFILLVIVLFSSTVVWAQPGGPDGPPVTTEPCECCEELEPSVDPASEYQICKNACLAGESPCTPIDSGILILLFLGGSLGIYKVYKNKKRQLVN